MTAPLRKSCFGVGERIVWDGPAVARLAELIQIGHSYTEIAEVLLGDATKRNEIAGACYRNGLSSRNKNKKVAWAAIEAPARSLAKDGSTMPQAAKALNISYDQLRHFATGRGLKFKPVTREDYAPTNRVRLPRAPQPKPRKEPPTPVIDKAAIWQPIDGATVVKLIDLKPSHCRWPVADGYCGLDKATGSYCAAHHHASVQARA